MSRIVRCQGAIFQDHQILLIQHREHAGGRGYWVLPGGEAAPGYEPEVEVAELYGIVAVQWFDLRDPATWEPQVLQDTITLRQLRKIQAALGYEGAEGGGHQT